MEKLKLVILPDIYESLINANVKSLSKILTFTKLELAQATDLDIDSVEQLVKHTAAIILNGRYCPARLLPRWDRISTGCRSIDSITKGGMPVRGISEIVGSSGVGKTQICMQLALMTQLPCSLGGLQKSVVYICTEDVFPIKRFIELANIYYNKYKICFEDNLFIEHVADAENLKKCLSKTLPKLFTVKDVGLIVIDSIAGAFRSENRGITYANRSQDFVTIAIELTRFSEKYGCAILCINQVTDNLAIGVTEPCLGLSWSNIITSRFNINRVNRNHVREFEIVFAPDLPRAACGFTITKEGITVVD